MSFGKSRLVAVGIGAAFVFAGISGCGGGGGSSDTLSKSDYIAQADKICAKADATSNTQSKEFISQYKAGNYDAAAAAVKANEKTVDAGVAQLKELNPPSEDQSTIDSMLALADKQNALVPQLAVAVGAGDTAKVQQIGNQGNVLNKQINSIADKYGFKECGSAGDS